MQHNTNTVILIGTLVNAGGRGRQEAARSRRTTRGATVESFGLELTSPYGEPFVVPLEASHQTPGAELITNERIGTPIVIEGSIRRRIVTDRRYAVADQDTGMRRAEVAITVDQIREPAPDEPLSRSLVVLEGTISARPRIAPHRSMMDTDMARMILQVARRRPGGWGSAQFAILEQMDVQITTPLLAEAYALYRPGNRVRVMGELDMTLIPQTRNAAASAKLDQVDADWPTTKAAIEASVSNPQERERELGVALRRYRNQRARLQEVPIITVVVGQVELLDGADATAEEVAELVRESQRRRPRPTPRMPQQQIPSAEQDVDLAIAPAADPEQSLPVANLDIVPMLGPLGVAAEEIPPTTEAIRPRRRRGAEAELVNGVEEVAE